LEQVESRRLAWSAFAAKYKKTEPASAFGIFALLALGLLYFSLSLIVVPIGLAIIHFCVSVTQKARYRKWLKRKAEWESAYPTPSEPELLHFHDPHAKLTQRDQVVLKIFNNWPGYPPFWSYLRDVVLIRDRNRCQVTGCPSRVTLHIHHKQPVSKGGQHVPDNLVTLCDFHHGLEPDEGHERIWGSVKTRYFTLVRAHKRNNRRASGVHHVRAHIRRLELVSLDEIKAIDEHYAFSCPKCNLPDLTFRMPKDANAIYVRCKACSEEWEGSRQLAEETGPRLGEVFPASRNNGIWYARWDMLASRTDSAFRSLKAGSSSATGGRKKTIKNVRRTKERLCPQCGSPMKLVTPRSGQHWKAFWGCTKFRVTGCRGSYSAE
jgi:ssDNA-binding Zn-finger/Zn-ribbon topoisomerase 1